MSGRLVVIGAGPAGLMAAETALAAGARVEIFDAMGSAARKFLIAGKGGLNLTHSEPPASFRRRYGEAEAWVGDWLNRYDADALRQWARGLGIETFVGSSGRVFPLDLKAAPLLRGWLRRLREQGADFHFRQRWQGWDAQGRLRFSGEAGETVIAADATVLALGGGSWAKLGADGRWMPLLAEAGVALAPLQPANCGFEIDWSAHFAQRFAGHPLKPVVIQYRDENERAQRLQGECVVTAHGLEGSVIYAIAARLRDQIKRDGEAWIELDLAPGRGLERLQRELSRPRGKRSLSEHLRRSSGVDGVVAGLLYETLDKATLADPLRVAASLKALPLRLLRPRPIDEAISTAGGVRRDALDADLMLHARPGVFCAGEMLDWEAPTGGYLLTAAMASGKVAGAAATRWLARSSL